jgi:hypothetical protein
VHEDVGLGLGATLFDATDETPFGKVAKAIGVATEAEPLTGNADPGCGLCARASTRAIDGAGDGDALTMPE